MFQKILSGKTAVITGGSKGLGKAMGIALAQAGAKVALVARNPADLATAAAEIRGLGGEVETFQTDVADEGQVAQLEKAVTARFGKIQILINNAGMNHRKPLHEFTLEEWNRLMNNNVTSVFLMCRAFIPLMKGQNYGRILNLTSMLSHVSIPGRGPYSASKTALLGLTRALALELAPDGITVNGISPGPFATELNKPLLENPEISQWFLSRIPLGRWGKVEEVGSLAVYLWSEAAGFITGTDIVMDGGWTAQ